MKNLPEIPRTTGTEKSITLVEDSKIIQKALVPFLKNLGLVVHTHTSGESALASKDTYHSDILFTDLNLETHVRGDEIIEKVANIAKKEILYILASASDTHEQVQQLQEKGIRVVALNKKEITHLRVQISDLIKHIF